MLNKKISSCFFGRVYKENFNFKHAFLYKKQKYNKCKKRKMMKSLNTSK